MRFNDCDLLSIVDDVLRTADHSFSELTDAAASPVDGRHILKCVTEFPRLGAALLWAASRDEAMVVEHLVSIGRRSALERTAHFFMELAERLSLVGLATETEFKCPLSQFVIADALGLTAIHVNRVSWVELIHHLDEHERNRARSPEAKAYPRV
jgi:hypothetical protein